jgi:hypothetical protein
VDEEMPPEMRHIQYDLSPERMERIWVSRVSRMYGTPFLMNTKNLPLSPFPPNTILLGYGDIFLFSEPLYFFFA